MTSQRDDSIPQQVVEAGQRLLPSQPLRRGSVSVRYVKCSKKGCACAHDPGARHGPYYSLTRGVGGKTRSRYLSPEQAETAGRQIEAGKQFREQLEAYWKASEGWADQELGQGRSAEAALQKKGSKKGSNKKSSEKSKG